MRSFQAYGFDSPIISASNSFYITANHSVFHFNPFASTPSAVASSDLNSSLPVDYFTIHRQHTHPYSKVFLSTYTWVVNHGRRVRHTDFGSPGAFAKMTLHTCGDESTFKWSKGGGYASYPNKTPIITLQLALNQSAV
jgi:hypothetical protein